MALGVLALLLTAVVAWSGCASIPEKPPVPPHSQSSVPAADPKPREILRKAHDAYVKLRSFHLERATTIEETVAGGTVPLKIADLIFTTASEWPTSPPSDPPAPALNPSRARLEFRSDGGGFLLLNDGRTAWAYAPKARIYSKGKSLREVAGSLAVTLASILHWFPFLLLTPGATQDAELVAVEAVEVNSEQRRCHVIAAWLEPPPQGPGRIEGTPHLSGFLTFLRVNFGIPDSTEYHVYTPQPGNAPDPWVWTEPMRIKLCIDATRHLILRTETTARSYKGRLEAGGRKIAGSEPVSITMKDRFTLVQANQPLPEALFSFTPPEGATERLHR